jgi:hypothetical protein
VEIKDLFYPKVSVKDKPWEGMLSIIWKTDIENNDIKRWIKNIFLNYINITFCINKVSYGIYEYKNLNCIRIFWNQSLLVQQNLRLNIVLLSP